jgi:hypothetical protein
LGCGMGYATLCLIKGNVAEVMQHHLFVVSFAMAVLAVFSIILYDIIFGKDVFGKLQKNKTLKIGSWALVGLLFVNWIYTLFLLR